MIKPSPFQQLILDTRTNLALPGGNWSGKTWGCFFKLVQHAELYGPAATVLWLRQYARASGPVFDEFVNQFLPAAEIKPDSVNLADQRVVIAGCAIEFMHLEDLQAAKTTAAGRNFTLAVFDECQNYDIDVLLFMGTRVRSSSIPTQEIWICNPGGELMPRLTEMFVRPAKDLAPGTPFKVPQLGDQWFTALFSNLDSNPFVDPREYTKRLLSEAKGSAAKFRMTRYGDFSSIPGAFFALSEHNFLHLTRADIAAMRTDPNIEWLAGLDHGTSAPAALGLFARCADKARIANVLYPRGTHVQVAEFTTATESSGWASTDRPWSIAEISAGALALFERYDLPHSLRTYVDDAVMSNNGLPNSVFKEYQGCGLTGIRLAGKGKRVPSLTLLREYIFNAAPPVNVNAGEFAFLFAKASPESRDPALYFNRPATPYTIACLQNSEADPANPDDLPLNAHTYSHGIDQCRYALGASVKAHEPGQTFTTLKVVHGDPERDLRRYLDSRAKFGTNPISCGKNHPLYKDFPK